MGPCVGPFLRSTFEKLCLSCLFSFCRWYHPVYLVCPRFVVDTSCLSCLFSFCRWYNHAYLVFFPLVVDSSHSPTHGLLCEAHFPLVCFTFLRSDIHWEMNNDENEMRKRRGKVVRISFGCRFLACPFVGMSVVGMSSLVSASVWFEGWSWKQFKCQSINQSFNQSINQSITSIASIDQSINQSIKQSINQSFNQSIKN